jgi:hypothetical protein
VVFIGVEKVNKVLRQKLVGFQTDHRTADSDSPLTGMAASNPPFKTRRNPYAIYKADCLDPTSLLVKNRPHYGNGGSASAVPLSLERIRRT